MLTFNFKTTFFTVKTLNEVYCLPYIFCQLHSKRPYNKQNITRLREDMDFMFSWQEQYLTRSLRSLVRYCSCHSNIKSISSRNRVISYIYYMNKGILLATKTLVESIRHYTRDPSGVFFVCHAREWYIDKFPPFLLLFFSKWPPSSRFVELSEDDMHLSLLRTKGKC